MVDILKFSEAIYLQKREKQLSFAQLTICC